MSGISVHAAQAMARSQSASAFMDFFHELPQNKGLAVRYFNHWAGLDNFGPNAFGSRQTALMMHRTAQAYGKFGRKVFDDGFRYRLNQQRGLWLKHATPKLGQSDPRELQFIIWAFGAIGLEPDPAYFTRWSQRAATTMNVATDADLRYSLKAHAYLGLAPLEKFKSAYFKRLDTLLPNLEAAEAACILWSLAVIDSIHHDPAYLPVARKLVKHVDSGGPIRASLHNIGELGQLRDACLWFGLNYNHALPFPQGNQESELEHEVWRSMKRAGMTMLDESARQCPELDKVSDIAFEVDGRQFWLEVDGYTHTIRKNSGCLTFDGRTCFQTALMNKLHGEKTVVRLPIQAWECAGSVKTLNEGERLKALFGDFAKGATNIPTTTRALAVAFGNGDLRLQALTS